MFTKWTKNTKKFAASLENNLISIYILVIIEPEQKCLVLANDRLFCKFVPPFCSVSQNTTNTKTYVSICQFYEKIIDLYEKKAIFSA